MFNATNQAWACCTRFDTGGADCANPSNSTFIAQPLWPFFTNAHAIDPPDGSQTSSASSVGASSSASSTPDTSAICQPLVSHQLSTGAQAGVGVAAAIAGLVILACLICLLSLKRRIRQLQNENQQLTDEKQGFYPEKQPKIAMNVRMEMANTHPLQRSELEP